MQYKSNFIKLISSTQKQKTPNKMVSKTMRRLKKRKDQAVELKETGTTPKKYTVCMPLLLSPPLFFVNCVVFNKQI